MPNSYFKFKQFTIEQDKTAMKVCTDACLFGAWVAATLSNVPSLKNILDIGTGTGLLSLMLAQKAGARFDAVEMDEAAAEQAKQNFSSSPWADRLNIYQSDIADFKPAVQYDLIISNPPFFENDLKSSNKQRNTAMHSTTLTLETMLLKIRDLIAPDGKAAVLIPYSRSEYFERLLKKNGFNTHELLHVKQSVNHDFFRSQYKFSMNTTGISAIKEIAIRDNNSQYTPAFTALLKDYYLTL